MESDEWEKYLTNTTLSLENKRSLTNETKSVEINFCCAQGDNIDIFEATISNLGDGEKLLAKLLQLERQIRFYEGLNDAVIRTIGFISPHKVKLSSIKKIVNFNVKIFKKVKAKIDSNSFICLQLGYKSELDI